MQHTEVMGREAAACLLLPAGLNCAEGGHSICTSEK